LIPVNIPKWAGVGAVRYIPDYLMNKIDEISKYLEFIKNKEFSVSMDESRLSQTNSSLDSDIIKTEIDQQEQPNKTTDLNEIFEEEYMKKLNQDIKEINKLNEQLVKLLQTQDGAFSIGQADDGLKAVKFGMVSELDALKNLASQVQKVGKTVEEDSRVQEFFLRNSHLFRIIKYFNS
jgi:hypothetical protein